MNKLKKVIGIFIITICVAANNSFAETKEIGTATRVRKEPSTDAKIVTVLYPGNDVEVIGEDGEWTKVQRGQYIGYVKTEYLRKLEVKDDESEINGTAKNEVENKVENKVENTNTATNTIVTNEVTNNEVKIEENIQFLPENKVAILIKTELHLLPNFFSKDILDLDAGVELEIIDTINNWYKVKTSSGVVGWILKSKTTNKVLNIQENVNTENNNTTENEVTKNENKIDEVKEDTKTDDTTKNDSVENVINKKGIVNVETANVRKEASKSSKRIDFLDRGDEVTIIAEENEFYKIKSGSVQGYVSKDLITVNDDKVSSRSLAEERKEEVLKKEQERQNEKENKVENNDSIVSSNNIVETSGNGSKVAEYAKQYLGVKYVLGGKTPETGFDCSGFTRYVFKNFGYNLGSIAAAQNEIGTDITMDNLKVGDLILFQNEERTKIGHTGIYIGNGEFVHAANPQRGVVIDNINTSTYYNSRFVNAKRIVE